MDENYANTYITEYPNDQYLNNKYRLKSKYEILYGDENHNCKSKIKLITYGDTAENVLGNHSKLFVVFDAFTFMDEKAEESCEEEAYKTCEELEAMNHQ